MLYTTTTKPKGDKLGLTILHINILALIFCCGYYYGNDRTGDELKVVAENSGTCQKCGYKTVLIIKETK